MNRVLIGNMVCLAGSLIMIAIGFIKKKENVLIAQCFQFGTMGVGNLILGGVTGAVSNVVSLLRNFLCYKYGINIPMKLVVIAIQTILSLRVNNLGLIGWLPVISAIVFTWLMDIKSDLGMKFLLIGTMIPWIIYDITIQNYVTVLFDVSFILSNCVGIYRIRMSK